MLGGRIGVTKSNRTDEEGRRYNGPMMRKLYNYLSRPEVGSSRKMIAGRVTNSTPMAVRFRSPPEMPADRLLLQRTVPV
jgi:hypothetical protein